MNKKVLVFGATGLVGTQCVKLLIKSSDVSQVFTLARREVDIGEEPESSPKLTQIVSDFSDLTLIRRSLGIDSTICTLGTTMKKAGSKAEFFSIEHDIPLKVADALKQAGCAHFIYLSSVGACSHASSFYLKTKGEIETALETLGFSSLSIVRPSLLIGKRSEDRVLEDLGQAVASVFNRFVPKRYRAIESSKVAAQLVELALSELPGKRIYENETIGKTIGLV